MPNLDATPIENLPPTLKGFIAFVKRRDAYLYALLHKTAVDVWANDDILNGQDDERNTPLHHAVLEGRPEMVKFLLDRGADMDARNEDGQTPLIIASLREDNALIIQHLLNKGADTSLKDFEGWCALKAVSIEFIEKLDGCDTINEIEINRSLRAIGDLALKTPRSVLMGPCALNDNDSVLKDMYDSFRESKAFNVIYKQYYSIRKESQKLFELAKPVNASGFLVASFNGNLERVKRYLADYANDAEMINVKGSHGQDALMIAVNENNLQVVSLLCEAGIRLDSFDKYGYSAVMSSIWSRHDEIALYLINRMPLSALKAYRVESITVATLALASPSVLVRNAVFNRLIKGESDEPNPVPFGFYNEGPLHEASANKSLREEYKAYAQDVDTVEMRANIKKDIDKQKNNLHSLVTFNAFGRLREQFPKKLGASHVSFFVGSFFTSLPNILRNIDTVLNKGVNINDPDHEGNTALMLSAKTPYHLITNYLIKLGANLNCLNSHGETALMLAARAGNHDTVSLLVQAGADLSHKNHKGQTAFDLSRRARIKKMLAGDEAGSVLKRQCESEDSPAKRVKFGN